MSTSLFISDLHLDPARPEGIALFHDFIREKASAADQLFILGDLFEYWLGDDACAHTGYQEIVDTLSGLSSQNTKVYFMHGNRDFLISQQFSSSISGVLLPDPTKFSLGDLDVLLMHGDSLCTDDIEHQQFRALTRSKPWQNEVLSKSIQEREELARHLRMNSTKGNAEKSETIMDVNQSAVESQMIEHAVNLLIHGHTHRTAIHSFTLNGNNAHRIVLGDWYTTGNYLCYENRNFSLRSYPADKELASLIA